MRENTGFIVVALWGFYLAGLVTGGLWREVFRKIGRTRAWRTVVDGWRLSNRAFDPDPLAQPATFHPGADAAPTGDGVPYWDREPEVLSRAESVRELGAACAEIYRLRDEIARLTHVTASE